MAVTILDIAKETGRTCSTVSRALNNCGRISDKVREEILEAAERLGYRPNSAGVALQKGRTNTIAVLLPELGNPFYADLLHYFKRACAAQGYDVAVYDYEYSRELERHLLQKMYTGFCDGVFAAVSSLEYTGDLIKRLWKAHVPVTILGTSQQSDFPQCYDYVSVDHCNALAKLFSYLSEHGKRHAVKTEICITKEISEYVKDRIMGIFKETAGQATLNFYDLKPDNSSPVLTGISAFQKIMKLYPETDVIIARNGMELYGMLASARERDIRIPDDLMFICCDNTWLNQYSSIPILAIDQHTEELAKNGFEMIYRRINSEKWLPADRFIAETTTVLPKFSNNNK